MPPDSQSQTLRLFNVLSALRPHWAHTLILSFGLNPEGAALALAANIAGATCLSVDRSPENCRAALRSGAVDFAVNSLDEALRTLKNEIREGHPLSVALTGDPGAVLPDVLDRGLLPELFTAFSAAAEVPDLPVFLERAEKLAAMGSLLVDFDGSLQSLSSAGSAHDYLKAFSGEHSLSLHTFEFGSAPELRRFDAELLDLISPTDPRRRWIVSAPRHFQRSRPPETRSHRRSLFLKPDEHDRLHRVFDIPRT